MTTRKHKHTEAPWHWTDEYTDSNGNRTWSLVGARGYGILSCDGVGNSPQGLGDDANERLIAAAPELLEAAKAALRLIQNLEHDASRDTPEGNALRAVIDKAEGL